MESYVALLPNILPKKWNSYVALLPNILPKKWNSYVALLPNILPKKWNSYVALLPNILPNYLRNGIVMLLCCLTSRVLQQEECATPIASLPGLPRFIVLRFAFSIIHGSGRAQKTGKA